jgi:drug/metabolite transporter (DMT)-like permease
MKHDSTTSSGTRRLRAYLALLGVVIFWGLNFPVAKGALAELPPTAFNALRFPLASLFIFVVLRLKGPIQLPRGPDLRRMIFLGILGNLVYQNLFIFGLANTGAGTASVLLAGSPMATALLSAKLGHEKVRPLAWIGIAVAFAGIAFVVVAGSSARDAGGGSQTSLLGDLLLLGATFAWAWYTVGSREVVERHGAVVVTAVGMWAGTIGLIILGAPALLRTDPSTVSTWTIVALLYSGALSLGLAYIFWYYGIGVLGNTRGSAFSNLAPIVALLAAWPLLGEVPRLWQFLGAGVILAGVTLTQIARVEQRRPIQGPAR